MERGCPVRQTDVSCGSGRIRVLRRPANVQIEKRVVKRAGALDAVVLRHVESLDADGLMRALEAEPRHACGGGPMVAVLEATRRLGATECRVLEYADSGDVSGDKSSVVGYMAAAIW